MIRKGAFNSRELAVLEELRATRERYGVTFARIAERVGLPTNTVWRILSCRQRASRRAGVVGQIAEALRVECRKGK
jgi:transcriptional regulator with XRE-family HTH domain